MTRAVRIEYGVAFYRVMSREVAQIGVSQQILTGWTWGFKIELWHERSGSNIAGRFTT